MAWIHLSDVGKGHCGIVTSDPLVTKNRAIPKVFTAKLKYTKYLTGEQQNM